MFMFVNSNGVSSNKTAGETCVLFGKTQLRLAVVSVIYHQMLNRLLVALSTSLPLFINSPSQPFSKVYKYYWCW